MPTENVPNSLKVSVKYEQLSAQFSNHVILNTTQEEVFLDFSTGAISDPATRESIIAVHTRMAMTHAGARRLAKLILQTLGEGSASPIARAGAATSSVGFPKVEVEPTRRGSID